MSVTTPAATTAANAPVHAVATIAYRDFVKFLRDPARIVSTFAFPLIFVVVLGGSLQDNLGEAAGYDFLVFTFTGVCAT
jgi:ABC-2 type transport system permease protein